MISSGVICPKPLLLIILNEVMGPVQLPMYPFRVLLWQPYPERLFNKCDAIQWVIRYIDSKPKVIAVVVFLPSLQPYSLHFFLAQCSFADGCELNLPALWTGWTQTWHEIKSTISKAQSELAHVRSAHGVGSCQLTPVCRKTPEPQIYITHPSFSLKWVVKAPVFHFKVFYFSLVFQLLLCIWPCNTENPLREAWKNAVTWSNSAAPGKWHWCTTGVRRREPYFQRVS